MSQNISVHVRIDPKSHAKLKRMAERTRRSITAMAQVLIERALDADRD